MYITDIIGEQFMFWQVGTQVFLEAPTGSGKTTFVLEKLLPYAIGLGREILYLSNRRILQKQLVKEVCDMYEIPTECMLDETVAEFSGITFMTYQALEGKMNEYTGYRAFPYYYYVICDEIHYITADSSFNPQTRRVLKWLKEMHCGVFIAISATLNSALKYLNFGNGGWRLLDEYDSYDLYVRNAHNYVLGLKGIPEFLYFYYIQAEIPHYKVFAYTEISEIVDIINRDDSSDKWLIFQSNKENASMNVKKKLTCQCELLTADDKECACMNNIVQKGCFEEKVLITTKVLENGISLHDKSLKNVVLETIDKTEFVQMLGRKRMSADDDGQLNVFIPIRTQSFFQTFAMKKIQPTLELISLNSNELMKIIMDSPDAYQICRRMYDIENGKFVLNSIAKDKLIAQKDFCDRMVEQLQITPNAFVIEQLRWMGMKVDMNEVCFLTEENKENTKAEMKKYLDEMKGKSMTKNEQKDFREKMTRFVSVIIPEEVPHKSRTLGRNVLNSALELMEFEERIVSVPGKKKGESTIWKIQ